MDFGFNSTRSPCLIFFTIFGSPAKPWIPLAMAKGDSLARVPLSAASVTTRYLGQASLLALLEVVATSSEAYVSSSEAVASGCGGECLRFLVFGLGVSMVEILIFITRAPHPPRSPTRGDRMRQG